MINRCIVRPIVRALVESCGRVYDQLWHPTVDRRSILASCDRSLRPTTDRTINRGTKRPILRSIVASCYRSYDQSCDFRSAIINSWWCHHARLVVRSRKTYLESQVISFEHDHRPFYNSFCPDGHPRPLRPVAVA